MVLDVGSLLAATSLMLCLFLELNKDYRLEDGLSACIIYHLYQRSPNYKLVRANTTKIYCL